MYNTNFMVKYNDIQEELLKKQDDEYSHDDILDICNKLYRDELVSVFYADDLLDDKIDAGMKYVLEKMLENSDFKLLTNEVLLSLKKSCIEEGEKGEKEDDNNLNMILLLTMFSQECFHLFHKCVCQQLTLGIIDSDLLVQLKQYFTEIFNN